MAMHFEDSKAFCTKAAVLHRFANERSFRSAGRALARTAFLHMRFAERIMLFMQRSLHQNRAQRENLAQSFEMRQKGRDAWARRGKLCFEVKIS